VLLQRQMTHLLREIGPNPLLLKLVAAVIRKGGIKNAKNWAAVCKHWEREVQEDTAVGTPSDYQRPLAAYRTACQQLEPASQHLLAVLQLFPHSQQLPAVALEIVWRDTLPESLQAELTSRAEDYGGVDRRREFQHTQAALVRAHILKEHSLEDSVVGWPSPRAFMGNPLATPALLRQPCHTDRRLCLYLRWSGRL
jgi:hypothetical protein